MTNEQEKRLKGAADKALLKMLQDACRIGKAMMALDLAQRLHSTKALEVSVQVARSSGLPQLEHQLEDLLEERNAMEAVDPTDAYDKHKENFAQGTDSSMQPTSPNSGQLTKSAVQHIESASRRENPFAVSKVTPGDRPALQSPYKRSSASPLNSETKKPTLKKSPFATEARQKLFNDRNVNII